MDNGIGFDYKKEIQNKKEGIGLFNILNRIKTINGYYHFDDSAGSGFKFELSTQTEIVPKSRKTKQ
jgi:signal transduction histidine kinase